MDHNMMTLVLGYLVESGPAKSGEVAEGLKSLRISRKYASLVLTRCYRRRLVSRRPYKRGRQRGYVYQLSDKGEEWLLYKASHKKDTHLHGGKPVDEVEERNIESPKLVISNGAQGRLRERDLFKRAVVEVLPAIKLCNVVLSVSDDPRILNLARWEKAYWQLEYQKLAPHLPIHMVVAINPMLSQSTAPIKHRKTDAEVISTFLLKERREEAEYLLYRLDEEREEKDSYKRLYNEKSLKCEELERELEREKFARSFQPLTVGMQQYMCGRNFRLEHQVGKLEAKIEQITSKGKLISSLLQDRMSKKQKDEEALHAILYRRCINERWWDLLPPGSNTPLPPVRGPARGT